MCSSFDGFNFLKCESSFFYQHLNPLSKKKKEENFKKPYEICHQTVFSKDEVTEGSGVGYKGSRKQIFHFVMSRTGSGVTWILAGKTVSRM